MWTGTLARPSRAPGRAAGPRGGPARGRYTAAVPPLSAVIITCDEERRLPRALASVAFCDEVVVLDGGSTDRTRELAAAAGARVESSAPWPGFVEQRNRAVAAARHDWAGPSATDRHAPGNLQSARGERLHDIGFIPDAIAIWSTPLRPVVGLDEGCNQ